MVLCTQHGGITQCGIQLAIDTVAAQKSHAGTCIYHHSLCSELHNISRQEAEQKRTSEQRYTTLLAPYWHIKKSKCTCSIQTHCHSVSVNTCVWRQMASAEYHSS